MADLGGSAAQDRVAGSGGYAAQSRRLKPDTQSYAQQRQDITSSDAVQLKATDDAASAAVPAPAPLSEGQMASARRFYKPS